MPRKGALVGGGRRRTVDHGGQRMPATVNDREVGRKLRFQSDFDLAKFSFRIVYLAPQFTNGMISPLVKKRLH